MYLNPQEVIAVKEDRAQTIVRLYEDEGNSLVFNYREFSISDFGGGICLLLVIRLSTQAPGRDIDVMIRTTELCLRLLNVIFLHHRAMTAALTSVLSLDRALAISKKPIFYSRK